MNTTNDRATAAAALGYDAPEAGAGGKYLKLSQKGDTARIRIVGRPLKFNKTYQAEGEPAKTSARWGFLVIHKDIQNGQPTKTVRAFEAGAMIYGLLYDLVLHPDWGDPTQYDIQVSRTEEKGKYYTVQPLPKPFGPLSDAEQQLVTDAGLDLPALFTRDAASTVSTEQDEDHDPFADDDMRPPHPAGGH